MVRNYYNIVYKNKGINSHLNKRFILAFVSSNLLLKINQMYS